MNEKSNTVSPAYPLLPRVSSAFRRAASLALMALATFSQGCAGARDSANQDLLARVLTVIEKCDQLKDQVCIEAALGEKFHLDSQSDMGDGRITRNFRFENESSGLALGVRWVWSYVEKQSVLTQSSILVPINTKKQCIVESQMVERMGKPNGQIPIHAQGRPQGMSMLYDFEAKNVRMIGSFIELPCLSSLSLRFPIERI